jgi:hypothetical protein
MTKPHGAADVHEDTPAIKEALEVQEQRPLVNGDWLDGSNKKEAGPGHCEVENDNQEKLTELENGLKVIRQLPATFQPEMFKELEKLGPLTSEVHAVVAHIQSGQPVQNQVNQLIMMFGKMLEQQHTIMQMLSGGVVGAADSPRNIQKGQQRLVL